jgi:hypothetical protein
MVKKFWSNKEESELKRMYEEDGMAPSEIAIFLNRSKNSIILKIQRLGFHHTIEQTKNIKSRMAFDQKNRKTNIE